MIHVIDGSEGALDSGRYPEPVRLLLDPRAGELVHVRAPFDAWFGPHGRERAARRVPTMWARAPFIASVRRSATEAIHGWGRGSAAWSLQAESGIELEATLLDSPSRPTEKVRRAAARLAKMERIRVLDAFDADAWRTAGVPADRLVVEAPDAARVSERAARWADQLGLPKGRDGLRDLLRAGDNEFLVFPIANPWSGFDAHRFVFLLGMLRINGTPATAIVPASAWRLVGARVFREQSRLGTRVCVIDGPMTPWAAAADAAFLDAQRPREALLPYRPRGALRVLIAAAEAAGVPIAVAPGSLLEAEPRRAPSVADELRPLLGIAERWGSVQTVSSAATPAIIADCVQCGG